MTIQIHQMALEASVPWTTSKEDGMAPSVPNEELCPNALRFFHTALFVRMILLLSSCCTFALLSHGQNFVVDYQTFSRRVDHTI